MKRGLILLLLITAVSAQEVDLTLNDNPLPDIILVSKDKPLKFKLTVEPGIAIEQVDVISNNPFFEYGLEALLTEELEQVGKREQAKIVIALPPGEEDVQIHIRYDDAEMIPKEKVINTKLVVDGKELFIGTLLGILPERISHEVAAEFGTIHLNSEERRLTFSDLSRLDIDELGLTRAEFFEGKKKVVQAHLFELNDQVGDARNLRKTAKLPIMQEIKTEKRVFNAARDEIKPYGKIYPDVTVIKSVYNVRYGLNEIVKTKVHVSVSASELLSNVNTILILPDEFTPKELVESAGGFVESIMVECPRDR